ncbi:hypothetical protein ABFS83_03G114400 [Erythranthe nasuta]
MKTKSSTKRKLPEMEATKQKNPKLEVEFLKNLPSEIVIEILSRLPIPTIKICKRVRKSWRDLIQTREFVDSHLSKSVPGLVVSEDRGRFEVFEFEDELLDLEDSDLRYKPVARFDCSTLAISILDIKGSVNGLLFLSPVSSYPSDYYVCNPITREFIEFPYDERFLGYPLDCPANYGFGVSKVTGQYKVVRIVRRLKSICHVYTLGTGKWRRITPPGVPLRNDRNSNGAFLNGCLHWIVQDFTAPLSICCFDLETETFSTFDPPPLSRMRNGRLHIVVASGNYLCVCDNTFEDEVAFWVMKEYGEAKSWTKQFVIGKSDRFVCPYGVSSGEILYPIKVFKDGHALMLFDNAYMCYYSGKTKTSKRMAVFGMDTHMEAMVHTPSFLSLKSFPKEYVRSFRRFH